MNICSLGQVREDWRCRFLGSLFPTASRFSRRTDFNPGKKLKFFSIRPIELKTWFNSRSLVIFRIRANQAAMNNECRIHQRRASVGCRIHRRQTIVEGRYCIVLSRSLVKYHVHFVGAHRGRREHFFYGIVSKRRT